MMYGEPKGWSLKEYKSVPRLLARGRTIISYHI